MKLITIDGPSASGKSSVSRLLAERLNWNWVSTGAFYRGLALIALEKEIASNNETELLALAESNEWSVKMTLSETQVFLNLQDRTSDIFGEKVGAMASAISQISSVRKALLERQRSCYVEAKGLVAEGRDCGTVVFPGAPVKIYLTASPALRAQRRSDEDSHTQEETLEMQKIRDAQDSQRKVAPLKKADGALHIDSTYLSLDEVVDEILKYREQQNL